MVMRTEFLGGTAPCGGPAVQLPDQPRTGKSIIGRPLLVRFRVDMLAVFAASVTHASTLTTAKSLTATRSRGTATLHAKLRLCSSPATRSAPIEI